MRQRRRHSAKNSIGKRIFQALTALGAIGLAIAIAIPVSAAAGVVGVYNYFTRDLPDPTKVQTARDDFQTTRIYDRKGTLLYEVIDPTAGDRQWVTFTDISKFLVCATVSNEDKTFYENPGFDIRGIARAFVSNLQGGATQGGSSITQQLVKNVIIPSDERARLDYTRKIKEVLLAQEITRRYSKNQILEWYINTNNYGSLAYGIEAAARIYFAKSASALTLAESAMLAAIPQFPTQNPFDRPVDAKARQETILDGMSARLTEGGIPGCNITEEQIQQAKTENMRLAARQQRLNIKSPHFSLYARDRAVDLLADHLNIDQQQAYNLVYRGGLKITTSVDTVLEEQIRTIVSDQVLSLQRSNKNANNGAAVVLKPDTGEILAMVGSRDYNNDVIDGKFNVALGLRQPGSSFKPITYIELLRQGNASPATLFWDVRTPFPSGGDVPYAPENYDRKYHGPIRMRVALARSYNIPAVDAMNRAGVGNVIRTAHKLGITDLRRGTDFYGLALTLGGGEVKLLDMAYVYSTFATGGTMNGVARATNQREPGFRELDPVAILRVEDQQGRVLYDFQPASNPKLLGPKSEQLTYMLDTMLDDPQSRAEAFGYPSPLDLKNGRHASVKTGTTNDNKDNWTVGYTPDFVTAVWVGNTDNTPMARDVTGISGAAPIWNDVMELLHKGRPNKQFARPDGLKQIGVCAIDGLNPNGDCPTISELVLPGTEPKVTSSIVKKLAVITSTGQLAPPGTPPEQVEEKLFYVFPPQARDWLDSLKEEDRKRLYPEPPVGATGISVTTSSEVAITFPANGGYVSANITGTNGQIGQVELRGSARGGSWVAYRLAVAKGFDPAPEGPWIAIGPDHSNQVDNGTLETLNLQGFEEGPYTLRLTRVEQDHTTDASVRFTIDNKAPVVKISQPFAGEGYTNGEEWVDVQADVKDNVNVARVEFFAGGADKPFAIKTAAPFVVKWVIPPGYAGPVSFYAVATDGAGNRARSPAVSAFAVYKR